MKKAELTSEEYHRKKGELDFADIQAFITHGYKKLNAACYILLQIDDTRQAKQYFDWLIKNRKITTADVVKRLHDNGADLKEAVHIAFTSAGLKKLELPGEVWSTFSREFIEGIASVDPVTKKADRSILLGDTGNNDPKKWHWGNDKSKKIVHCVLMLFAPDDLSLAALKKKVYGNQSNCFKEVYLAKTYTNKNDGRKEHFGFMDGISKPVIKGLSQSNNKDKRFNNGNEEVINAGEFILGYENTYGHYSRSPYVEDPDGTTGLDNLPKHRVRKDLGKNGTYLVFRQMEQHVERFWKFQKKSREAAGTPLEKAVKLAAKMIGRWPNGLPLVTHPAPGCPIRGEDLNDFKYSATDKDGVNCPLGAHIRRTNPRDQTHAGRSPENSLEVSGKHRMLRRGRIYGEPLDENMDIETMIKESENFVDSNSHNKQNGQTPIKRGLHFICLVSDISRQFEFVQSVWANTSTFGDLCNEVDQVIAPRPTELQPDCIEFTTPQKIIRNRYKDVPQFTTVVGGGYFFLPGIKALKYIISNQ